MFKRNILYCRMPNNFEKVLMFDYYEIKRFFFVIKKSKKKNGLNFKINVVQFF